MTRSATAILAASLTALCVASAAHATPPALVSGQTLTLPLTEESGGAALKVVIGKATLSAAALPVPGETRAEAKARDKQIVLDSIDGRNLVKFVRVAANDLRTRYTDRDTRKAVGVTISVSDDVKLNQGALMGDSLKAGFTLGIAAPSTTPMDYLSHIDVVIAGPDGATQTLSCDAKEPGRTPRVVRRADAAHAHDELDRMADAGRTACWTQLVAKLSIPDAPKPTAVTPPPASAPATPPPAVAAPSA